MSHDAQQVRRRCDQALIVVVCLGLALPTTAALFGWTVPFDALQEKRPQAIAPIRQWTHYGPIPWPKKSSIDGFPRRFEAYFNDRYGFRRELIGLYTQARIAGLTTGALDRPAGVGQAFNAAIIGRDGWLYLSGEGLATYRAAQPFTSDELDAWAATLRARRDWLAERGCKFVFFVAPDKPTIYPENLPPSVTRVGKETRHDQLSARLADGRAVTHFDARPLLLAGKSQYPTYYQTDTHWNQFGAWLAYGELLRRLQPEFPQLQPAPLAEFDVVVGQTRGDLETLLPSSNWPEQAGVELRPKQGRRAATTTEPIDLGQGKYDEAIRSRNAAATGGKALVVHDSFMLAMQPFLSEHFRETVYVHNRHGFPAEVIERERPDVVIFELVERELLKPPPGNPPLPPLPQSATLQAERGDAKSVR